MRSRLFLSHLFAAGGLSLLIVGAFLAGPVFAEPVGVTREAVVEVLNVLKLPVTLRTSEAGTPAIDTTIGDVATTLQLGDCSGEPAVCKDVAFIATFDETEVPDIAGAVARNGTWSFAKTFIDPDAGVPGAEMALTLVSGDLQLRLSAAVDLWRSLTTGLVEGFPAEPQESVLSDTVLTSAMMTSPAMVGALFAPKEDVPERQKLWSVRSETLVEMLKKLGYEVSPANDDGSMLWVEVAGLRGLLSPRFCNEKFKHCGLLSIVHVREARGDETNEALNEFNVTEWFVRAFFAEDGRLIFSFDAPVFEGMSLADLDRYLSVWQGTVVGFEDFMDERE
ncbi:MAG: hypothetical protein C0606_08770 [Hyphomicrobiales bacterium]|nr:MAG: hypothetical protein C0606_08770 [Hyphomicrobiales bacterium]